ncbi:MAG TPA: sulfite exporter TauE/SafE family protein [bacterium]|nr:sulfite exporter TauE/SafE family protein [bacterium]
MTLTFAAIFFPLEYVIPLIIPLNLVLCIYLVARHHDGVDYALFLQKIIPLTLLGMPVGMVLYYMTEAASLKWIFGLFVLALSLLEIAHLMRRKQQSALHPTGMWPTIFWLLGCGVVQGLWVSGGPVAAYWAGRNIADKKTFRSTLSLLWIVLNVVLLITHLIAGTINVVSARASALLLPAVIVGIVLGEIIHTRLPERGFRLFVYLVLAFAGVAILLRG